MKTLRLGTRGAEVAALQRKLSLNPDGIFGQLTLERVREFQTAHGLIPDGIAGPKTLAALDQLPTAPPMRSINAIIVHCTATPEGEDFTLEQLRQCHTLAREKGGQGWSDIGYHYFIDIHGRVHKCRPEAQIGAHTAGHNSHSIGVSYAGGCAARTDKDWQNHPKDTRTAAQKAALEKLLRELLAKYPHSEIYGHRDFAAKACPSFDARKEYAKL